MSIDYLLNESNDGKCYLIKVSNENFKDCIAVIVEKNYSGNYEFSPIVADIYINSHDPRLELIKELPKHTHYFRCGVCCHFKITEYEDDPSVCDDCINKSTTLNKFAIADSVYLYKTNQELKYIIDQIDGISHHNGDDEDMVHQSEQGLVVTDTHQDDFDDFPLIWYRIVPRNLIKF